MQGFVCQGLLKYMKNTGLILLLLSVCFSKLSAQYLSGFSSQFDNDLAQWVIYPEDEQMPQCELRCRWQFKQDPTEWDFRMGDISGTIRSKWKDRLDEWEVISENQIARLRMVWPRDPREWRIESGDSEYVIRMKYNHPGSDWEVENDGKIIFSCSTAYQNDIRDWIIRDDLPEQLHFNARIAMVFAVILSNLMN